MNHKQGSDRYQMFMFSLDSSKPTAGILTGVNAEIIDANAKRVNANPEYYRERQQIRAPVWHP